MSFLGELVGSIGGERAPAPPLKPPSRPASTNPSSINVSKSAFPTPAAGPSAKAIYKGTLGTGALQQGTGLKRKAEEISSSERPVKLPKPNLQTISDRKGQQLTKPNGNGTKSPTVGTTSDGLVQSAAKPAAKAPTKGSYAEIMARAKEAQSSKAPSQIGMIKHQSTDKVKVSKLAERRKEEQDKAKAIPGKMARLGINGKSDPRHRSVSPAKKGESAIPKILKAPKPPLHGPAPNKAPVPVYRGTMGQAPKKARDELRKKKSSRQDEYLATDEEDEGDLDEGGGYGIDADEEGYSDASSEDMEAPLDDIFKEEGLADRQAREDDKRELELEARLKKEKQKKLAALAAKSKRHY